MLATLLALCLAPAEPNWPKFRGPAGDGVGAGTLPAEWSEKQNVVWKTAIHDKGWSSAVALDGQIWLTTAKADGKEFFALGIDKATGKILHDVPLFTETNPAFCHAFNSYASPTPAIEPGRVYCHFGTHGTACINTATGKIVWTNRELRCNHHRGPGSSPILVGDLLILTFDGIDVQYVCALDKQTGKVRWKQERAIRYSTPSGDFHKAYATPNVLTFNGTAQLVAPSAEATIAYEPATGKELWRVSTGGMNQSMPPILAHDLIYLSGGHQQKLVAVKAATREIAWTAKEAPTRPGVLVIGDRLVMVNDKGICSCLNSKTGKLLWKERLDGDYTASPVAVGDVVCIPNEQGKTYVFRVGDEYKLLGVNALDAGCMASPAPLGDRLILRTKTHLYCISAKP